MRHPTETRKVKKTRRAKGARRADAGAREAPKGQEKRAEVALYGGPGMYPLAGCPGWFTNQPPPHLRRDVVQYAIRRDLPPRSYLRQTTAAVGPVFGASLIDAARFGSRRDAQAALDRLSSVAQVGSAIEEIPPVRDPRDLLRRAIAGLSDDASPPPGWEGRVLDHRDEQGERGAIEVTADAPTSEGAITVAVDPRSTGGK